MKFTLETVANIINDNTEDNVRAYVEKVYEDYGAGLMWDTVIVENTNGRSYQCLSPRLHDMIVNAHDIDLSEIQKLINRAKELESRG